MNPLLLTQSQIADFTFDKRLWYLRWHLGLRPINDYRSPATIGTFVHSALARYYSYDEDLIGDIRARAQDLIEDYPQHEDSIIKDMTLAEIMCEGYLEWLAETGADYDFEKVEPERVVKVELGIVAEMLPPTVGDDRTVLMQGRLDGKVQRRNGWTAFLEHKTVPDFVGLPAVAQVDRQLLGYELLEFLELRENGVDKPYTDGAILNMLRKVKRTASAKPPFYERLEVRHNPHELKNHWNHVLSVAQDISEAEEGLAKGGTHHQVCPPGNGTDKNSRWKNPYLSIYSLMDDGSDWEAVAEAEFEVVDPYAAYKEEVA